MSDRHFVHQEDEVQLAKILKESKPWLERNATTLIYALAAVLAVAAVFVYVSRRPPANAGLSQNLLTATLENAPTPESYQTIADEAGDTPLGLTSRLRQAELLLTEAVEGMFTNRKNAMENLDKAKTAFERLSENRSVTGSLRERVLAGLARTLETRSDGTPESIKTAVAAWENVLKEFPDSRMFKELAEDRIKKLPAQSEFLAWFAAQNPAPADDLQLPQDGTGPGPVPPVPGLGLPSLSMPNAGAKSDAPATTPAEAPKSEGDSKAPEATATEPATETPTTEQPSKDKEKTETSAPSETAAPATEPQPAAETPTPAEGTPAPASPEAPAAPPEKAGE